MIRIELDHKATVQAYARLSKQLPYASAVALNRTGEDANAALRQGIPTRFTIRERKLIRFIAPERIPSPYRATKTSLVTTLRTERAGHILDPFQFGIPKKQKDELTPVAIPTQELRPSGREVIPRKLYPQNLGLTPKKEAGGHGTFFALGRNAIKRKMTPFKTTARGAIQIKGKLRTFVLDPQFHRNVRPDERGVYQRTGPGKGDIRMIWQYRRQVPRPRVLEFYETAQRVFTERFQVNLRGAIELAMRTAR